MIDSHASICQKETSSNMRLAGLVVSPMTTIGRSVSNNFSSKSVDVVLTSSVSNKEPQVAGDDLSSDQQNGLARRKVLRSSDYLKSFFCGAVGGMSGCCYSYPLDTIKVRAQAIRGNAARVSYTRIIQSVYKNDGLRGFYRGIPTPMMGVAMDNAGVFTVHVNTLALLENFALGPELAYTDVSRPLSHLVVAGLASGVTSALILTPFELVKCRIQLARLRLQQQAAASTTGAAAPCATLSRDAVSSWRVARSVIRDNGIRDGLFIGLQATMWREIPGTATWLLTYHYLKQRLTASHLAANPEGTDPTLPLHKTLLAGGCAGCAYWTVSFPSDVVKTRQQSGLPHFASQSFFATLTHVAKTEGLRGLYRGYGITMLRAFPSNAIIFAAYEKAARFWDKNIGGAK